MLAVAPWRRVAPPRVARGPQPRKGSVLVLDHGAEKSGGPFWGERDKPDRPPAATRISPPAPQGNEAGRRRRSGPVGIRTPTSRLQGERASKLHHEPVSTSGAGVEPARPRGASGLAPRCVPVPPAGQRGVSRCPPYASFWFRRHCTKRRIPDLLPRGLAVSPIPSRASRSLDHPPWRRCRFKCGCPASRPPGLRRAACVVERGRSSAAVVATVSRPRAPGPLLILPLQHSRRRADALRHASTPTWATSSWCL